MPGKCLLLPLLAAAVVGGCDYSAAGPGDPPPGETTVVAGGFDIVLSVRPHEVRPQEGFTVDLRVTNRRPREVTITTSHGCLALPSIHRGGDRIPFEGTALGCTAAVTDHTFGPGETAILSWEVEATLYAERAGDPDGVPAPAGDYVVRAEFDPGASDDRSPLPTVEAGLRVVEEAAP